MSDTLPGLQHEEYLPLEFPYVLLDILRESYARGLPQPEAKWYLNNELNLGRKKKAEIAFRELHGWIERYGRAPQVVVAENGDVQWEGSLQKEKAALNEFPEIAVAAFLSWNDGWGEAEITRVACQSPKAAYILASKYPAAELLKLQGAMKGDPRMAYYFVKNLLSPTESVAKLQKEMAEIQTKPHSYWHYMVLRWIVGDPLRAEEELQLKLPYEPEAASTWLRIVPLDSKETEVCVKCLRGSPEWSFLTAYKMRDHWKPQHDADFRCSFWGELRETALRNPQWAYHWWKFIEPEGFTEGIDSVIFHPGWAAQAIADVLPDPKKEITCQIDEKLSENLHRDDALFSAFVIFIGDTIFADEPISLTDDDQASEPDA